MPQERSSAYETYRPDSEKNFSELQELLVGEYIRDLHNQRRRIDDLEENERQSSLSVAQSLATAAKNDPKIRKTLFPVIEDALRISVDENPSMMAGVLFPIVGEAVRKAVAHSMQQFMDSTNELLSNSFSSERLKWRFEAWKSGKSFAEVALAHSLSFRVEHIYIVHRTTGLLLGQLSNQDDLLQDSDMVVGMLTAIQDFVRDSFTSNKQADLDVIQVGQFKIWLQHGPIALLAAVISGTPKASLREVLARHCEDIHRSFQVGMARFETTGEAIPGLEDGLKDCLVEETKAEPKEKKKPLLNFKVVGCVSLSLFAAAAIFYGYRAVAWDNYILRLQHQPGIVVIENHRGWRTLSVRGLRDPMAADPDTILADSSLLPSWVSERWEPYYSLDQRFVNARRLNNEVDAVRKLAVRFQIDSTLLPVDQLAVLDNIANQVQELVTDATRQRRSLFIHVYGHTDSSGSSEHNEALSQYRAEVVVRFLVERGMNPNIFTAAGVRDTQLTYSQYTQYAAEVQDLDRRVTFTVDLR